MRSMSPVERADLYAAGTKVQYEHETTLMLQGHIGRELFLLLDGFVKVTAVSESGTQVLLAFRAKGDLVGEFSVLDDKPRSATVTAVGAVVAVRVSRTRFRDFLQQHPGTLQKITGSVLSKMRSATGHRIAVRALDAKGRLARVLLDLTLRYGEDVGEGIVIGMPLAQFELGALASVSESTTERILKEFREAGLVITKYRRILVQKPEALRALAGSLETP